MPLTAKGREIMENMTKEYGPDKAKHVFYASRNAGKITGVDPESSRKDSVHSKLDAILDSFKHREGSR